MKSWGFFCGCEEKVTAQELHSNDPAEKTADLKAVLAMSVPMVVTTCSPLVMRLADFAFVSKLGTAAQAAIVPTQMVLWTYMAMSIGIVTSVTTFAAQCLGKNKLRDCSAYAWQSVYISLGLGVLGLGLWFAFPPIFAWLGHEPAVMAMELRYAQVSVWAILPTIVAHALGSFFSGVHRPRVTMLAAIEANAINIVLNYALIFGAWGLPAMGFTGAALGTVIAAFYNALRLCVTLWLPATNRAFGSRSTWRIDWPKIRGLWRVGMPQGVHWFSDVMVWALFVNVLIGRFGTIELAASNVAWQYVRIAFMPMIGIGQALTSLVGKAIGQGDSNRALRLTRISIGIAFLYIAALSVLYVVRREALVRLFSEDDAVVAIGMNIMICLAVFQLFDVLGTTYYHALRGAGDTTWPMLMYVVSHWCVVIGGGYVVVTLKPELGGLGPWIVATVLISLTGVLLRWRWASRAWMKMDIFSASGRGSDRHEEPVLGGGRDAAELEPSSITS